MAAQSRSISSFLTGFFRRPVGDNDYDGAYQIDEESLSGRYDKQTVRKDYACGTSDQLDKLDESTLEHQGTLVLTGDETNYRPPIVSILPIERLRLLRLKQEWRRRVNSKLLLELSYEGPARDDAPTVHQEYVRDVLNTDESQFSYKLSNTPSPVKQDAKKSSQISSNDIVPLRTLKRKKVSGSKRRGTKWSADFEYDLTEYDNILQHKKDEPLANLDSSEIDSPQLSSAKNAGLENHSLQGTSHSGLSSIQRSLLINGPNSITNSTNGNNTKLDSNIEEKGSSIMLSLKDTNHCTTNEKKNKLILPSVGFDFIKKDDNETPSKKPSFVPTEVASKSQGAKPHISSTASSTQQNDKKESAISFPLTVGSEKQSVGTHPTFRFGKNTHQISNQNQEEEEEEQDTKRKKRTISSNDQVIEKPSFSFAKASADAGSKKSAFKFGTVKEKVPAIPPFHFGKENGACKQDIETEATAKSPNQGFKVGGSGSPASATPPSQPDGQNQSVPTEKPIFSFHGKEKSKEQEKSSSFKFGSKNNSGTNFKSDSSFSFGRGATESKVAPSFNVDATAETKSSSNPSFSFGTKTAPDTKVIPTFNLSAGSSEDRTNKPSFIFGNQVDKKASPKPLTISRTKEENALGAHPTSTENHPTSSVPNPSFSVATPAVTDKIDSEPKSTFNFNAAQLNGKKRDHQTGFNFGSTNQESLNSAETAGQAGFSFSRISSQPDNGKEKAQLSFGASIGNAPKVDFSFGKSSSEVSQAKTLPISGFSFSRSSSPSISGPTSVVGIPSLNSNPTPSIAKSQSPGVSALNPFINSSIAGTGATGATGGFTFGSINQGTNVPLSVFSNGQTLNAPSASSATSVPAFQQSITVSGTSTNPPSRSFTPSNTINLNFGNTAAVDPTSIFADASHPTGSIGGATPAPQQIFGGPSLPPSQIFGGGSSVQQPTQSFNNSQTGFGNNNIMQSQQGMQASATSFQLPPGRKLARMRNARRG
ncbi:hypothetical protein HG535_0A03020 [Zygotorulaspora mrakii]|uniref:Uncharacterized protein n=1 Tax=Zygotorulaspora mrakii TaxID=42260 RepID=A0A7H9AVZ0_ZYGMR|nr:uncharacterized protein HG535_0A03020 [Zygotorulaspora mrakii]QLG70363.1 hypothetical protein HG535_0A03020 [Zygotorulaspora mrakii]